MTSTKEPLEVSLSRYQFISENIDDIIWQLDSSLQFVFVTPAVERNLGYTVQETLKLRLTDILDETGQEKMKSSIENIKKGGERKPRLTFEFRTKHKNGSWVFMEILPTPLFDEKNNLTGFIGVARNITSRKNSEELLKLRMRLIEYSAKHSLGELLQKTLDEVGEYTKSLIGFYHFVEPDQKTISLQAWSTETLTRFCKAEGKGEHYPLDSAGVWVDCVREGRPVIHNDYASLPNRKGLPEGHAQVVRELVVPIYRDEKIVAILGVGNKSTDYTQEDVKIVEYLADIAWEITERKRTEEALQKNEKRFRLISNYANDIVWQLDMDLRFTFVTSSVKRVLGYTVEEALKLKLNDLMDADGIAKSQSVINKKMEDPSRGHLIPTEYKLRHKEGHWLDIEVISSPMLDQDGNLSGFVGVTRDITTRAQTETALRESEERFRLLAENSTDMISRHDPDGMYLYVSPSCRTLLGYEPEEIIGHSAFELIHPDDSPLVDRSRLSIQEQPITDTTTYRMRKKDGTYTWLETTSKIIPGNDRNQQPEIHATTRDITSRKLAEAALLESQKRLKAIIDHAPFGAHLYTLEPDGRLVLSGANQSADQILQLSHQQFIGKTIEQAFPPLAKTELPDAYRKVARTGERFQMDQVEYGNLDIHGTYEIQAFQTGENKMAVFFRDITEQKRAETALRESEERYRTLAEAAHDMIFIINPQGKTEYINNFAAAQVNRSSQELVGKDLSDIFSERVSGRQKMNLQKVFNSGEPIYVENEAGFFDKETWLGTWLVPLKDDTNQVTAVMGISRDITDRIQTQDNIKTQIERLEALRRIDATISSSTDLRLCLDAILDETVNHLKVDAAAILIFNPYLNKLEYKAGKGFRTPFIEKNSITLGEGYAGRAAIERKVIKVHHLRQDGTNQLPPEIMAVERFDCYYGLPLIVKGKIKGVLEIYRREHFNADESWERFLDSLAGQAAIAIDNAILFENLQRSNLELGLAYDTTLEGWSGAIDLREGKNTTQTKYLVAQTLELARGFNLTDEELAHLRRGVLLHDVGKISIPESILNKTDPLTNEEWQIIHKHPLVAHELLAPITFLRPALDVPYCHHEKWDGTGYPRRLSREQIPLAARIFAVVDVYDALTSDRPYRKAWTKKKAAGYILEQAGKHFDPDVVNEFQRKLASSVQ
ncbi:MAG: PAS domain S-box protein [Anaerolineales bacterium]|nr:PAS domain S-box protein [Anaerolineales bacterium]